MGNRNLEGGPRMETGDLLEGTLFEKRNESPKEHRGNVRRLREAKMGHRKTVIEARKIIRKLEKEHPELTERTIHRRAR